MELPGITPELVEVLIEGGFLSCEDVAVLTPTELTEMGGLDEDTAARSSPTPTRRPSQVDVTPKGGKPGQKAGVVRSRPPRTSLIVCSRMPRHHGGGRNGCRTPSHGRRGSSPEPGRAGERDDVRGSRRRLRAMASSTTRKARRLPRCPKKWGLRKSARRRSRKSPSRTGSRRLNRKRCRKTRPNPAIPTPKSTHDEPSGHRTGATSGISFPLGEVG